MVDGDSLTLRFFPGLRRSPLPLGISMAKRRAELAGRITESAVSSIGKVADEVRVARIEAVEAVAKAKSVQGTIQS